MNVATSSLELVPRSPSSTALARTSPATTAGLLAIVGTAAANSEGLLAYDKATTPPWLGPVLDAQAAPRVSATSDLDLLTTLIAQFQKAALNLGHSRAMMDKDTASIYAREVLGLLRQRWHYLTMAEVEQVFHLGSLAQLLPPPDRDGRPTEEVIYLSPKTIGIWLQRYKYQVKPLAMTHARRLSYASTQLPPHHPVFAAWRIARLVRLAELPPAELRQLTPREGDFKNLLFFWLKEIGALGFRPKAPGFWDRLEALDKAALRRTGQLPPAEHLLQMATGQREKYADRLDAAKRWRTLCLWLVGHRQRGTDLPALLWPLAEVLYTPPTTTP